MRQEMMGFEMVNNLPLAGKQSTPCSKHINPPTPHHSIFYVLDALRGTKCPTNSVRALTAVALKETV